MAMPIEVSRNDAAHCYEAEVEGYRAVAEYRVEGDRVVFTHTFVPPELRGRGIGQALVRSALEETKRQGRRVVLQCTYVAMFVLRNPEFQPLLVDR